MANCSKCKDCKPPKRNATCHSTCKDYLEWQEKHQEEAKLIRKKKYLSSIWKY